MFLFDLEALTKDILQDVIVRLPSDECLVLRQCSILFFLFFL